MHYSSVMSRVIKMSKEKANTSTTHLFLPSKYFGMHSTLTCSAMSNLNPTDRLLFCIEFIWAERSNDPIRWLWLKDCVRVSIFFTGRTFVLFFNFFPLFLKKSQNFLLAVLEVHRFPLLRFDSNESTNWTKPCPTQILLFFFAWMLLLLRTLLLLFGLACSCLAAEFFRWSSFIGRSFDRFDSNQRDKGNGWNEIQSDGVTSSHWIALEKIWTPSPVGYINKWTVFGIGRNSPAY